VVAEVLERMAFIVATPTDEGISERRVLYEGFVEFFGPGMYRMRVACTQEIALELTANFTGDEVVGDDRALCDALQELSNVIAGALIQTDEDHEWRLGPASFGVSAPGAWSLDQAFYYELDEDPDQVLAIELTP